MCENRNPGLKTAIIAVLLLAGNALMGQDQADTRRQLDQIKRDIGNLQQRLRTSQKTLRSTTDELTNIDEQTTLLQEASGLIRKEIRTNKREIIRITDQITDLGGEIDRQKKLFKKQVQFVYKYQGGKELEWILGSANFNQAMVRYRYFRAVGKSLQQSFNRLTEKKSSLETLEANRLIELNRQETLAREQAQRQQELTERRAQRQSLIDDITRDKSKLEAAIKQKQDSYKKLEGLIGNLERERVNQERDTQVDWSQLTGNFGRQKGRLPWPVNGDILHPFGQYRNPKLKTTLINSGIDIQAVKGTEVRCVFEGVASMITYMGGYGRTLIIDHNNGYYTVYAHLQDVHVQKFEVIQAGTVIGTVGDSGSLEGAMLHFEIYGDNQPQNPQTWLGK